MRPKQFNGLKQFNGPAQRSPRPRPSAHQHHDTEGTTRAEAQELRVKTIDQGYCATACPCDTPRAGDVAAFPVDEVASSLKYIMPRYPEGFVDSNSLLRQ